MLVRQVLLHLHVKAGSFVRPFELRFGVEAGTSFLTYLFADGINWYESTFLRGRKAHSYGAVFEVVMRGKGAHASFRVQAQAAMDERVARRILAYRG